MRLWELLEACHEAQAEEASKVPKKPEDGDEAIAEKDHPRPFASLWTK